MRLVFLFLSLLVFPLVNMAQETVSGQVFDFERKTVALEEVVVRNLNSGKVLQTAVNGHFTIAAKKGDLLAFSKSGYHIDTLFLANLSPKRIFLPVSANELNEVNILGARINSGVFFKDPEAKKMTLFETDDLRGKKNNDRAGGLKFNLGYGKYRKAEIKKKQLEERDGFDEEINSNFNDRIIFNLIKLQGEDLRVFKYLYKPSVLLVSADRPFDYNGYIVKAYNTWLKLPPEQRKIPTMPKM
jgi:hypothetical protein